MQQHPQSLPRLSSFLWATIICVWLCCIDLVCLNKPNDFVNPANGIKIVTRAKEASGPISFDCVAIKDKEEEKRKKKNEENSILIMESSSNVSKRKLYLRSHQPKRRGKRYRREEKKRYKQHKSTPRNSAFPSIYLFFVFFF